MFLRSCWVAAVLSVLASGARPATVHAESLCYGATARRGDWVRVHAPLAVQDRFGARGLRAGRPAEACRPIGGAADAITVARFLKPGDGRSVPPGGAIDRVTARFGTEHLRVGRPDRLEVAGALGGSAPRDGNRAACYRVHGPRRPRRLAVVTDAQGEHLLRVGEPTRLCELAWGAEQLCYAAEPVRGAAVDGGGATVITSELGTERLQLAGVRELCTDTTVTGPPAAPGFFLQIAPTTLSAMAGEHVRLNARAFFSTGGSADWSDRLAWRSSDETVAVVRGSAGGAIVDALGPGSATIAATDLASGVSTTDAHGDATVTVTWDLEALTISPHAVRKPVGGTEDYTVIGHFAGGKTLNLTQRVVYSSSAPGIVSTPNTPGRRSHVVALAPGIAAIAARDPISGLTTTKLGNDALLRVAGGTPYVQVEPDRRSRVVVDVGSTFQFTARATTSDGLSRNLTQDCVWTSMDPAVLVPAPLDAQRSRFMAVGTGSTYVTCTDPVSGVAGIVDADVVTTELTALQARISGRALTADQPSVGTAVGVFAPFGVQDYAYYGARNRTQDVQWVSRDPGIVATPNTPGNRSALVGVSAGTARVYVVDPITGMQSPDVLVTNYGELTAMVLTWPLWGRSDAVQIAKGHATGLPFNVRGIYELGNLSLTRFEPDTIEIEVADPSILRVTDGFGLVGVDGGRTTVTAHHLRTDLRSPPLTVTVVGDIESLSMAPAQMRRAIGESEHLTVRGVRTPDVDELLTQEVRYETSDPSVATVSSDPPTAGLVHTEGAGTATITAVDPITGVRSNPTTVEVLPGAIERVTISPASRRIARGLTTSFTATGHYADGRTINVTPTVRWMADRSAVTWVRGSQFEGIGPGTTRVTAVHPSGVSSADSHDDATLTVEDLRSIEFRPPRRTGKVGTSVWFTLVGVFADGGEINLTQAAQYFTSNGTIAVAANDDGDRSRIDLLAPGTVAVWAYADPYATVEPVTLTITP